LLDTNNVKAYVRQAVSDVLGRGFGWEMSNYSLDGLLRLSEAGKVRQDVTFKVFLGRSEFFHLLSDNCGSAPSVAEFKIAPDKIPDLLLQLHQVC
jgi:hypothetical protein